MNTLRIGTRASALALWQARHIRSRLMEAHPGLEVELVPITTQGDRILDRPLALVGGKGLFVKEIEQALLDKRVDLAVHSVKDLPADMPEGLVLGAIPPRADNRDALVSRDPHTLADLPQGACIGTSSLRRRAQILRVRPDLKVVDLRGNVDTRIRKVDEAHDGIDAAILAVAGLTRLEHADRISEALSPDICLPAIGQGALGIQIREGDTRTQGLIDTLHDIDTFDSVEAERSLLRTLEGSCHLPIAGMATLDGDTLTLRARIGTPDGSVMLEQEDSAPRADAHALGHRVALALIEQGAREIIDALAPDAPSAASNESLTGVRVIVTRDRDRTNQLTDNIRARGGVPIILSAISIAPPEDVSPILKALKDIANGVYDWVLFTSANAAEHMFQQMVGLELDASLFRRVHVAAIGEQTADYLRCREVSVDLKPAPGAHRAEGLLEALLSMGVGEGSRCLLPVAAKARPTLPDGLRAAGATVDTITAYHTVAGDEDHDRVQETLSAPNPGYLTFGSGSAVQHFLAMVDDPKVLDAWKITCIGPVTARVAQEAGLKVALIPGRASYDALLEAIAQHHAQHAKEIS